MYGDWEISSGALSVSIEGQFNSSSEWHTVRSFLIAKWGTFFCSFWMDIPIKKISDTYMITEGIPYPDVEGDLYEYHYTKTAYTEGGYGGTSSGGGTSDNSMYFTNFTWTATQTSVTVKFYTNERATSATIKYGENSASSSKSATITNKEISTTITGLKKGTKYYVKCIARNSTGSVTSEEYPVITNY